MKRFIIAAMALSVSSASAQTKTTATKVLSCDPKSALLNAPTIYGVGRSSIVKACPAFEKGVANFFAAYADSLRHMNGEQAIQWLLHGPAPLAPKDTTPPVVIVPVDSTPKPPIDSTPKPPVDTTSIPAGAIANTHPMGALTTPFVVVPRGSAGRSTVDIQKGGGTGTVTGEGAVRILCNLAKMAFDDPIVFPGQPGVSHLHQFFGNTNVNAFTNADSIANAGNGTCSGGIANRTGYWTPAMIAADGTIVAPTTWTNNLGGGTTIYYKVGYQMPASVITPAPTGLKMVAGDKTWSNTKQNQEHVWWTCDGSDGPGFSATIPDCLARVELVVIFPQCWDGVNLDSPDHKSHMSYPIYSNNANGSKCPAAYPVAIPEITELFYWNVPAGVKSSTWHISSDMDLTKPGGLSAHADWMMGWQSDVMAQLATCLRASKDVGTNGLCNNTYMNPP
jgi:hypothetical protein